MTVVLLGAALVAPSFVAAAEPASSWNEDQKILASDGASGDHFGQAMSLDGNTVIIGAQRADSIGQDAGAAYVYTYDGSSWNEDQKILASDGGAGDRFGRSVSLEGDTAIIGASRADANDQNAGAAYVFARNETGAWNEQAKLTASDGAFRDFFGWSVALEGDTVIVGAFGEDTQANSAGAAYVYTYDGSSWNEDQKILASDGTAGDHFAQAMSLDGDTVLFSAHREDTQADNAGAVYVYTYDGSSWNEDQKLLVSDGSTEDRFGRSLRLEGDTAIIGAHGESTQGDKAGAVYVYTYDGSSWNEDQKILASDGGAGDRFGSEVSLDGDTAIIGAHREDTNGDKAGAAYVFARNETGAWDEQDKLLASDGDADHNFGGTVGLERDTAIIGADDEDTNGNSAGAAYVFENTTVEDAAHDATQNDAGTGGDASDDPDDPTPLPGGVVIHINGTLIPVTDPVDAYGTAIDENVTRSMRFHFNVPATMGLELTLLDPDDVVRDTAQAPLDGGEIEVQAQPANGEFLKAGEWTTVLRHGLSPQSDPLVPDALASDPTPGAPGALESGEGSGDRQTPGGGGVVPDAVPNQFTVIDYRDKRPCNPRC